MGVIVRVTGPLPAPGQHPRPVPDRPPGPAARRAVPVVPAAIVGLGLVGVVAGSFLPWVVSGQVRRSSYAITGVVDRLDIAGDGLLGTLVGLWPFFGPLCVVPVIAGVLRWWRTAGIISVLLGLISGALAVSALLFAARRPAAASVSLHPLGPSVMAAGAVLLAAGGVALVVVGSTRPKF